MYVDFYIRRLNAETQPARMPSAASVKLDKQLAPDTALVDSSSQNTPIRQALVIIEHKIRNLEKRKVIIHLLHSIRRQLIPAKFKRELSRVYRSCLLIRFVGCVFLMPHIFSPNYQQKNPILLLNCILFIGLNNNKDFNEILSEITSLFE